MTLPKWLRERIVDLVHSTLDEHLTRQSDDFTERIDRLERMEKLASDRIDAMDTTITELRETCDDVAVLKRDVLSLAESLSLTITGTAIRIRDEEANRSDVIQTVKNEFQKDIDRLDSLFRHPPKSKATGKVKLDKKTR